MDLTRQIIYRGFTFNPNVDDAAVTGGGGIGTGITGCFVDTVDFSDVDIVQFLEKRSQSDGMDAGDVHLGSLRIRMAGTLYALTRALLFDDMWTMRAALNPVLAQREEPLDKGYLPIYFSVPTNRVDDYPTGTIDLQIKAMPRAKQLVFDRDRSGGSDADSLAIPWQATFLSKDPGIYGADPVDVAVTATSTVSGTTGSNATDTFSKANHGLVADDRITFDSKTGGSGLTLGTAYYVLASGLTSSAFQLSLTSGGSVVDLGSDVSASTWVKSSTAAADWTNRGTYLGTFNAVIEVGAGAGSIVATVGDSTFTVAVPASTGNRIIRIKGTDKLLTVEENAVEVTRIGWITFSGDTTWPLIDPGVTPYSLTFHGMSGIVDGSHFWFYEQYA